MSMPSTHIPTTVRGFRAPSVVRSSSRLLVIPAL
ncbi:MAG: hypothetical protein JWO02_3876 [Solirubrobacterales bacterium]|nr:hypothetical protein [Solirubrobacterales bacterium]